MCNLLIAASNPICCYAIFAPISPRFYSLNKLTLVEESQSQSADYSWQIPQKI